MKGGRCGLLGLRRRDKPHYHLGGGQCHCCRKMKNGALALILLTCLTGSLAGQIPEGYYSNAEGLTGKSLQQALHDIIDGHTEVTYADLWQCFSATDEGVRNSVWDITLHSRGDTGNTCNNFTGSVAINNSEGDCQQDGNTHFQQAGSNDASQCIDLFHIYPHGRVVNNKRETCRTVNTAAAYDITKRAIVGPILSRAIQGKS